jgi:hypothetical protein
MSWGPWQYETEPEIGDWIKLECEHEDTFEITIFIGIVIEITEDWIKLVPDVSDEGSFIARRWAKKALAESIEVTRKATVDA